jgi:hypothetical protein
VRKIIFLTEMGFIGKVPRNHDNMRTEFAWMVALDAEHQHLGNYKSIEGYDLVVIIWPKGKTYLNSEGIEMTSDENNLLSKYLDLNIVDELKKKNKLVSFMQEGPTWFCNDYTIPEQFKYYNQVASSDIIFCHNEHDQKWYNGMYPDKPTFPLRSLMIEDSIKSIEWKPENKVLIGGNFARWYGGFQSYLVADELKADKWIPSMHNKRDFEDDIPDLNHLPYLNHLEWLNTLSTFKYGIHLMPTIAAGTFSLNCAYFGIPCIGNNKVDTQSRCFPQLSVDVEDVESARKLARRLADDSDFYHTQSETAKHNFKVFYSETEFKEKFNAFYKFYNTK